MKLRYILVFVLLHLSGYVIAQQDFRPGYVVLNSGDTLKGEIDYRSDLYMNSVCVFRENSGAEKHRFSPDSISAYRFNGGKYFVSELVKPEGATDSKRVFLEYLIKGSMSVYTFKDANGDHYFIGKRGYELLELPYREDKVFDQSSSGYNYVRSTKHIDRLKYYTRDAPSLKPEIDQIVQPDQRSLIKLATEYNGIVCKDTACIVYDKQPFKIRVNPEFLVGVANFSFYDKLIFARPDNSNRIASKNYFHAGVLLHFWLPRASEKLFFKTGMFFYKVQYNNNDSQVFVKLPLHFEYLYPKGVFRPNIAFGPNFYFPGAVTLSVYAGAKIKLVKAAHLSIGVDIDGVSGFSVLGGLYFLFE